MPIVVLSECKHFFQALPLREASVRVCHVKPPQQLADLGFR